MIKESRHNASMRILAIETSCDETAVAVLDATGGFRAPKFNVRANAVASQIALHAKWGGVVPNLARREHERNLIPVLKSALLKTGFVKLKTKAQNSEPQKQMQRASSYLKREPKLLKKLQKETGLFREPKIGVIAVTSGPGLEPALWVGVNFARALSALWGKPIIAVNHMEGHIAAALLPSKNCKPKAKSSIGFPALALLVSGGHTELVFIKNWLDYKVIGETRDDAAGEVFDKVARMLGLAYPGGPEIARLAERGNASAIDFPRPMIDAKNFDFSFSGLKTSVLYYLRDHKRADNKDVAASFQRAAVDVLLTKTLRAAKEYKVKSIILGGGVAANESLRKQLGYKLKVDNYNLQLFLPDKQLATDNAAMIGAAAYFHALKKEFARPETLRADAGMKL